MIWQQNKKMMNLMSDLNRKLIRDFFILNLYTFEIHLSRESHRKRRDIGERCERVKKKR